MTLKHIHTAPKITVKNEAGGPAHLNSAEWQLAKLLTTGMLGDTFYVSARNTNDVMIGLARKVAPEFLAKAIVYARNVSYMRSNPMQLLVVLSTIDHALTRQVYPLVVKTMGDILDIVTVATSGQIRKELGSTLRKLIRGSLNTMDAYQFVKYGGAGQRPSVADVIRMAHPIPANAERDSLFAWMIGKPHDASELPEKVKDYLAFIGTANEAERIALINKGTLPHEVLTAHNLTVAENQALANRMPALAAMRNLAKFDRLSLDTRIVAERLANTNAFGIFPFQILSALNATGSQAVKMALNGLLDRSVTQVGLTGRTTVLLDKSGSMGGRINPQSSLSYYDVGSLMAATLFKANPLNTRVLAFDTAVENITGKLNGADSVGSIQAVIKGVRWGGATAISCGLTAMIDDGSAAETDTVIIVTDNVSWVDSWWGDRTGAEVAWNKFLKVNPNAKLVYVNVAPYTTDQAKEGTKGVTFVSGFSDSVFRLIGKLEGKYDFPAEIMSVQLS